MHDRPDEQPDRIGQQMALAALDHLLGGIAAWPARLGGLDRLAVDHTSRGAGFATLALAFEHHQNMIDGLPHTVITPAVEIPLHCAVRWEVLRQHAPLAARL